MRLGNEIEKTLLLDPYDRTDVLPTVGGPSPWGSIQHVTPWGTSGAVFVETASHGGMFVPGVLLHLIPAKGQQFAEEWSHGWGVQWYEEDSAILFVIAARLPGAREMSSEGLAYADERTAEIGE